MNNRSKLQPHVDETRRRAPLLAIVLLAVAVPVLADACDPVAARGAITAPAAPAAPATVTDTGRAVAGGPVYRLPTVNVVASRRTELAREARKEPQARSAEPWWKAPRRAG